MYIYYTYRNKTENANTHAHMQTQTSYTDTYIHVHTHTHKLPSACSDCIAVRVVYTLILILTVILTLKAIADTRPTHHNHMNCTSAWSLTLKCNATSTHINPHSQQVLLHLLTYVHTQRHQVTLGPRHNHMPCTRHWYNLSQQCYTTSNLHLHQFPAATSPVDPFQTESALLQ